MKHVIEGSEIMARTKEIYLQKRVATALEHEFGFAPARLNKIVPLEVDDHCFNIRFRIGTHYYIYRNGEIERTDDKGAAL
jgi:hypothetical protein